MEVTSTQIVSQNEFVNTSSELQLTGDSSADNKDIESTPNHSTTQSTSDVPIPSAFPSPPTHDNSMVFVDSLTSDDVDSQVDESSAIIDPLDVSQQEVIHSESVASKTTAKAKGLVYKITVKDGKQVLAKVDSSTLQKNSSILGLKQVAKRKLSDDSSSVSDVKQKKHSDNAGDPESSSFKSSDGDSVAKEQKMVGEEQIVPSKDAERNSEKSNRDRERERSKDHKNSSSRSTSSSSKPRSSSSTANKSSSSSRSSRDEKDRHRSSHSTKTSSSSRDKSREKSSSSKSELSSSNQANKDKETLSLIMPQSTLKLGKIPKKSSSETEKSESHAAGSASVSSPTSKKPSISIEVRKDFENRPKTVKTFNSKFRSHGLAEEAPPPPSRKGLKKPQSTMSAPGTTIPPSNPNAIKRHSTSPTPEMDKKPKLDVSIASNHVDKPGSIKLISPKPKRKYPRNWTPFLMYFCPLIHRFCVVVVVDICVVCSTGRLLSVRQLSTLSCAFKPLSNQQSQQRETSAVVTASVGVFYV